ncbi:ABC transporter substrate-binding protein [Brachybacterium sacelli]|uniref:Spermidine/putrescine transport system substrate-binding protein n=1 Tax=Brachybacterium sacelli TaxID=173364 RepID=A0ABS4X320_9MICO|nr:extracellular solute-binding protein [Brachybacterium sacelli]MBP2382817.1 putative spermidine/putrescine transport system substrate-binding protein [Brachybacterium sacelli]
MASLTRRQVLAGGALALSPTVPALTSCTVDTGSSSVTGTDLTICAFAGAWSDTLREAVIEPFEEETGATVNVVVGAPSEWLAQLRVADRQRPPFDLMAFTPDIVVQAAALELIAPLETDKIKHFDELSPTLLSAAGVGETTYGVPLTTGTCGLMYRTEHADRAPENWSDIFDEQWGNFVGVPPFTYSPGLELLAGLLQENGGTMDDENAVDEVFTQLEQLSGRASVFPSDAGSMLSAIQQGDAWVAPFWDGRAFAMADAGDPVGFSYPASGGVGALTSYYVAAGTEREQLAYEFLGTLAQAENQKVFGEGTLYAAANLTIDYSDEFEARIAHGEEVFKSFAWVDYTQAIPRLEDWQTRWNGIFG